MRASTRRGVSVAARGRSCSGPLGSAASQTVAFLGFPAVGAVYVRVYGLRPKSLCGGCVWWNRYGDVGVRDRQLDDEDARRSHDESALNRRLASLRAYVLEGLGNAEQGGLT